MLKAQLTFFRARGIIFKCSQAAFLGQKMKKLIYRNIDVTPPYNLNIFIGIISSIAYVATLYFVNSTESWFYKVLGALFFAHIANTAFSLLHEAVHSVFHYNRSTNYYFGVLMAALFPTAYTFQKRCHLNHHRNNRTKYETFEMYDDKDNYLIKTATIYGVLIGIYYFVPFLGCLWLLLHPKSMFNSAFAGKNNYEVGRMGGASMLRSFENLSTREILKMRLEVVFTIVFQLALFYFLNLTFLTWALCFLTFGIFWSSLQYADHAFSARDIRNGAWNLKVNPITRIFFLNYHFHQAHHQHPNVSWLHLPKFVDTKYGQPSFWEIYLKMWKGLVKLDPNEPDPIDPEFEKLIESEHFSN